MNKKLPKLARSSGSARRECGRVHPVVLLCVFVVAGFAGGVYWQHRRAALSETTIEAVPSTGLSENTTRLLANLETPVEIRFYALFNAGNENRDRRSFAARVGDLLAAFEQAASGRISVVRHSAWSEEATRNAGANGILPQNLDKGDPFYLGVALLAGTHRETLPQLLPEWEAALEFDLARALGRLAKPAAAPRSADAEAEVAAAREAVQRALPNLASLSLEEGRNLLRENGRKEFEAAVAVMQKELQAVQERIVKAEADGDDAARQAGLQEQQQIRTRHTEKFRENARRIQAQVEALEQMRRD